jgi:hypothetical protein
VKPLLDTHILIHWIAGSIPLLKAHRRIIEGAGDETPLWVSDITLWEVATLHNLGRVEFDLPLRDWLERATAPPRRPTSRDHACGSGRSRGAARQLSSGSRRPDYRRHRARLRSDDLDPGRSYP